MLNEHLVVVVVPAFQEEAHVGRVLATMPDFVDHVLVVDDGSFDRTSEVARGTSDARVRVLRHAKRRGVGAAIATGYAVAIELCSHDEDAIAVMAGDGQMDPADLDCVTRPVVTGEADYVKGDRFGAPGVRGTMGLPRWIGGQVFSRLTSLAVGQRITDSQCGFTAISRRAAAALDLDGLWPGFGYPNDLLGQLLVRGARVGEVSIRPVYGTETSKQRLRHLPAVFVLIARAAARRVAHRGAPGALTSSPKVPRTGEDAKDTLRRGRPLSS